MPKAKKIAAPAKAKSTLAQNRARRRARRNPEGGGGMVANPPMASDLTNVLLPGFAAFAATRTLSRVVFQLVSKRWPKLGKHASALAGVASFGAVWFFAHKSEKLAKYHDGIVVGSGVAAAHGIATCYLPPRYAWLLTECRPEDVSASRQPQQQVNMVAAKPSTGDEFDFLERELEGLDDRPSHTIRAPKPSSRPISDGLRMASGDGGGNLDPDLSDALDGEDVDDLYTGAFSTNN